MHPDDFCYKNRIVLLSEPRAWSLKERVKLLEHVTGKEVKLVQVGLEEHVVDSLVSEEMGSH